MKRFTPLLAVVVALAAILLFTAQTGSLLRDLKNSASARVNVINALHLSNLQTDAFTADVAQDTVKVPGVSSTSIVVAHMWTSTTELDTIPSVLSVRYKGSGDTVIVARDSAGIGYAIPYLLEVLRY